MQKNVRSEKFDLEVTLEHNYQRCFGGWLFGKKADEGRLGVSNEAFIEDFELD